MDQIIRSFSKVLAQLHRNDSTPRKTRERVLDVRANLHGDPQVVVNKVHTWISERPYALKVELEVARALMHTFSHEGTMQTTIFRQYQTRLEGLGYET